MPEFEPTDDQRRIVLEASGIGLPHDKICRLVISPRTDAPISGETLRKHFRQELDTGSAVADLAIGNALFRHATGSGAGAVAAAIWWTKARMGWKETQQQQYLDEHGNPTAPAGPTINYYGRPEYPPAPEAVARSRHNGH